MIDVSERNRKIAINRWNKVLVNTSKRFTENSFHHPLLKARIIGYLFGDGSVSVHAESDGTIHYSIGFYPDDKFMLRSFVDAFVRIYEMKPSIKDLGTYFSVRINSKPIALDLLKVSSFKSLEWTVPEFSSVDEKIEFLRAMYDCEGYVGKNVIAIHSVNQKGLISIKNLLIEFKINSHLYSYERKNNRWNVNYLLYITDKQSIRTFLKHIGFYHSRKQATLTLIAGVA